MPQRNGARSVAQLLSNNNNLLSGSSVGGSGVIDIGGNLIISNRTSGSNNNVTTQGRGGGGLANGRHFIGGNPVAAAAIAAAAAASSSSASSLSLNSSNVSATQHHLHHQPPPPPQPPPLITDTLNACLDVNGTYICTSYSPRCYIIQKVTPNTITVTPHVIGAAGESTSVTPTNSSSSSSGTSASPSSHLPSLLKQPSTNNKKLIGNTNKLSVLGGNSVGLVGACPSSTSSHLPHHHHHHHHLHHHSVGQQPPPPHPPFLQQQQQRHFHFSSQQQSRSNPPQHHANYHPQHHQQNAPPPHLLGNHSGRQSSSSAATYLQQKNNSKTSGGGESVGGNSNYFFQKSSANSAVVITNSVASSASIHSVSSTGRVYMNGEVGSTTAVFSGEESIPAMVHQSTTAAGAGPHFTENRLLNGLKDGTREQMKPIESNDIDFADASRRNDPGTGANSSSDIPKEELKRLLLQQLEYYFSPENLANDKFLVSQMDSDHYVYISTLANFNMVKKLTGDIDLVTEVLRDSKNVQVHSDGKRVRPVSHRTVVILRGIPEHTPVDEIKALFNSENCPKCNSCEFAFNDSWYVSFDSDEDAQRAHRYLREDVKEFKGQPIMARIKSRPTTLLAQGAGVHLKNGYHQPAQVMGPYLPPAFVPGSQTGPSPAVPQTSMYAHGQTVPSVFPLPPNYNYGHWPGFFGMGPEQISQMYNPMNGLAPQHQPSSSYSKSLQMNPRPRNPNQVRPRRPPPSSSDNQGINGVVGAAGGGGGGGSNSGSGAGGAAAHQSYANPSRKNNNNSTGAAAVSSSPSQPPPPLLNIVPNPTTIPLVPPTSHNHHSQQGHHHITTSNTNTTSHSSIQGSGNAISQNGRHYVNNPPISASASSSSHSVDSYHPSGSMRPYRGGVGDSRPRSSLSNRKGPPVNRREEEVSYDGPSASPSMSAKVPSSRGAPSNANVPVTQPSSENPSSGSHHQQPPGKINFDLEGSAFPPLPGSGQSYGKNGDAVFEGRLSDVVKGVKNMKTTSSSTSEKDDSSKASATTSTSVSTEIIVSAEANHPHHQSSSYVREVSAASPIKDVVVGDVENKKVVEHHASSQTSSSSVQQQSGKKEFREVGVGSADDTHDIRSSLYKSSVLSGARSKETADKSTRTDEALLNGDQSQGLKTCATAAATPPQSYSHSQNGGGNRKSGVQTQTTMTTSSTTTSTKSPISSKRAVPALQVQNASTSSSSAAVVSVGPEVPYSSRTPVVTSPVTANTTSHHPHHAKSSSSQTSSGMMGGVSGGSGGSNSGNSIGRGANPYVAKSNMDNNNSRANGMMVSSSSAANNNASSQSNLNTVDKEAFPSPTTAGLAKSVPTTISKPFPTASDQTSKEVTRTDNEKDRRETGQGDGKKGDDCSTDERDCPMRLSYAQVAQTRKDGSSNAQTASGGVTLANSTSSLGGGGASSLNSSGSGGGGATLPSSSSSALDDKKKSNIRDTKDSRPPPKNQRGNGGGGGGDRDRGFRRGFRNRMMSDHSDGGGSATSGDSNNSRRIPKPSKSPK